MDWDRIDVGAHVRVRTPDGSAQGEVTEVGGRLIGKGGVDPAWARVAVDQGRTVVVSEVEIEEVIDDA